MKSKYQSSLKILEPLQRLGIWYFDRISLSTSTFYFENVIMVPKGQIWEVILKIKAFYLLFSNKKGGGGQTPF